MPTFPADAKRIPIKVFGTDITAPAPFAAGYTLSENEAAFFNRAVAASAANPFASGLAKLKEGGKTDELAKFTDDLQKSYDDRYFSYEIGVRGTGEPTVALSPLDKMIHNLASQKLEAIIVAKGRKVSEFRAKATIVDGKNAFARMLAQLIEKDGEALTAQAQSALDNLTSDMDIDLDA